MFRWLCDHWRWLLGLVITILGYLLGSIIFAITLYTITQASL